MNLGISEGNTCGITNHQGEEPDRIPYDDMGEVNGKNIENEATTDVVTNIIDGTVVDFDSAMVK